MRSVIARAMMMKMMKMMMLMMMTMMGTAAISGHELRASLIALLPAEAMLPGGRASGAPRRGRSRRAEERWRLIIKKQNQDRLATELWRRLDADVALQAMRDAERAESDVAWQAMDEVRRRRQDAGLPRSIGAELEAAVDAAARMLLTVVEVKAMMAAMTGADGPQRR